MIVHKINLKEISFFANVILLFAVLLDPTNDFLGIKTIAFFFFVIVSLPYIKFDNIFVPIALCIIYFLTFSFGLITDQQIDVAFSFLILKSFLFLLYLFWMNNDYLRVFSVFYKLTIVISIIIIVLFILFIFFPVLEGIIYAFMSGKGHPIMISRRTTLGVSHLMIYFRASAVCVISLSVSLYLFFSKKKSKYFIHSCLFFLGLLFSGTRANILSGFLITIFLTLFYLLYYKKAVLSFIVTFCSVSFTGILLIISLFTDTSRSTEVKVGHFESMMLHFAEAPVQFLLIGAGPGSMFYSSGFNKMTVQTELTYMELIRNFGLVLTVVMIFIFCVPSLNIAKNKQYDRFFILSITLGYIAYLFIAGTNPLLISSTGLIVFSIMFYISQNNILKEIN